MKREDIEKIYDLGKDATVNFIMQLVLSVTQNDPGSAIKMTPLPRLKKTVDQQIEFVNPESLFLPANEFRR